MNMLECDCLRIFIEFMDYDDLRNFQYIEPKCSHCEKILKVKKVQRSK